MTWVKPIERLPAQRRRVMVRPRWIAGQVMAYMDGIYWMSAEWRGTVGEVLEWCDL